jgi:NitT/TauT family transport system permease protein
MSRAAYWRVVAIRLALAIGFVASWELASGPLIKPFWISSPSAIVGWLQTSIENGYVLRHTVPTVQAAAVGYAWGAVLAVLAGFVLGRYEQAWRVAEPFLMAIQGIPKIALAPLFIIWFGIGITSKIVLVSLIVFFLVFFNVLGGVKAVSHDLRNTMRLLGASEFETMRKVILPATLPWIFVGLRVSIPNAMIGAVVGEFMAASKGLGYSIQMYTSRFDITAALALVAIIMVVVISCTALLGWIEARVLRWRPKVGNPQGSAL